MWIPPKSTRKFPNFPTDLRQISVKVESFASLLKITWFYGIEKDESVEYISTMCKKMHPYILLCLHFKSQVTFWAFLQILFSTTDGGNSSSRCKSLQTHVPQQSNIFILMWAKQTQTFRDRKVTMRLVSGLFPAQWLRPLRSWPIWLQGTYCSKPDSSHSPNSTTPNPILTPEVRATKPVRPGSTRLTVKQTRAGSSLKMLAFKIIICGRWPASRSPW